MRLTISLKNGVHLLQSATESSRPKQGRVHSPTRQRATNRKSALAAHESSCKWENTGVSLPKRTGIDEMHTVGTWQVYTWRDFCHTIAGDIDLAPGLVKKYDAIPTYLVFGCMKFNIGKRLLPKGSSSVFLHTARAYTCAFNRSPMLEHGCIQCGKSFGWRLSPIHCTCKAFLHCEFWSLIS